MLKLELGNFIITLRCHLTVNSFKLNCSLSILIFSMYLLIFRRISVLFVCLLIASTFLMTDTSPRGFSLLRGCWETWSWCTRWSSGATGYLWQSCNDGCKCLGKWVGIYAKNNAGCSTTGKAYQCKCHGYGGRKKSWCGF